MNLSSPVECECRLLFFKKTFVGLKLTPTSEGGISFCDTFATKMITGNGKVGFFENNDINIITFESNSSVFLEYAIPEFYFKKIKFWFKGNGYACAPKPEQPSFLLTSNNNQQYDKEVILSVP